MFYLLSPELKPLLKRLAVSQTLCAFDFDGTLAPIVSHPDQARIPATTRELFRRLAKRYPCVILSGRGRSDLIGRVAGLGVKSAIGNHGAEPAVGPYSFRDRVTDWKNTLERSLAGSSGVWVEDKGISLTVHYRQSPHKREIPAIVREISRSFDGARVVGGKQVVNLVIQDAPHKGSALVSARRDLYCRYVLYVGDDENDEDAFALRGNVVTVRIGQKQNSQARYFLRRRGEIDVLIRVLIELRDSACSFHDKI